MKKFQRRVLPVLGLGILGFALPSGGNTVTENDFIGGDGGPMIVLQASATSKWQGAADFDNSLMSGGNIETDYDVICQSKTGSSIKRHGRDMLVLDDSEWGAYIFPLPSGEVAIVQQFQGDDNVSALVERVRRKHPTRSFSMNVQDTSLRLLVGAEDGHGKIYGYKDVTIMSGKKRCNVFCSKNELVIIINPA